MILCLIAIVAPPVVDEQVRTWKEYMLEAYGCKVALKSPAHITLIPPLKLRAEQQENLQLLLTSAASDLDDFTILLKNFAAFAPRVIYIDVMENEALQEAKNVLEDILVSDGLLLNREARAFHPHVTIANRDLKKEDFPKAWSFFRQIQYEASFNALAISLLIHNGSVWKTVFAAPFQVPGVSQEH